MADIETDPEVNQLEDLLSNVGDGKLPSRKEMLEMLQSSELSEEMKENLKSLLQGNAPQVFGSYGSGTLLAILFVVLIFSIIFFFGYKLYRSIKDKELKKEEKKKAKQMKKKK